MNGATDHHDVIGSLGKVLSSVNLAGDEAAARRGFDNTIGSHPSSWTGLSTAPKSNAPSGISYGLGTATSLGNGSGSNPASSLQNVLYDSGIYEKDEVQIHRRASTGAVPAGSRPIGYPSSAGASPAGSIDGSRGGGNAGGGGRMRKPSIDIFLSQSPSKALGEDAFRLSGNMSRTNSIPDMMKMPQGHVGKPPGMSSTAPSSRSESPLGMSRQGGGLSSSAGGHVPAPPASTSPYGGGGSIPQYNPTNTANNYSQSNNQGQLHMQLQQQHQQAQVMNQFAPNGIQGGMQGMMQQQQQQQQPQMMQQQPQQQFMQVQQPQQIQQPAQQQSQVFYMAVTGPDGKQVLQPVQMVQMPGGQAGTIMMPMQQQQPQQQQQQVQQTNQQGMQMLMQPQQQRQNGGGNPMYGGGLGSGQQQQQQQQQQQFQNQGVGRGGGDAAIGSSAYIDNLLGQQAQQTATQVIGPDGQVNVLYSSPQRPPLRALLGNVRRLSRDQVGCRLLQQALDEDGPSAATAILNEGLTFWAEAMVDPFGNYLFQKILERITPEERVTLVSSVSTRLVNASLNLHGTRSVQKIVEVCAIDEEDREDSDDEEEDSSDIKSEAKSEDSDSKSAGRKKKKKKDSAAKILTDALRPSAARLCIDSHGNHAIQRILLKLPYQRTQFIFDAVAASVEDVARHRHGCCVIQRCLDSRHSAARSHLVDRIVEKSLELMQDAYGNYVVQYVLDVCGDDEVHAICESVVGKVCVLAVQKFSSNVMEKCLERCTDRVREDYLNELNDSDRLRELMMDPFGNYVVQRALSVSTHAQAIRLVETMKPHLSTSSGGGIRNTAGGRRILGKICRRFPNFQLEGETFEDYDLNQVLARSGHHAPTSSSPHHGRGGPRGGGGWDGPRGGGGGGYDSGRGGYDSGRGGYDSGRGGYGGYNAAPGPSHGGHRGGGRGRYRPGYGNHNQGMMNGGGNGGYGPPGMAYGAGPPGLQGLQVQADGMGMMGAHQQPGMYQGGGVGGSYMYNHQGM